jgi:shikimate dehydrogenase
MNTARKKACVMGWPIAHSRSPMIHGYWLKKHGISGTYDRVPVEPENLASFFQSLRDGQFTGCNVTLPHKHNALKHIDLPDERVTRIGALNTVWKQDGKLHATSTDGPGFLANLQATVPDFKVQAATATVFGAGGSARAIIDELLRNGCTTVTIYNRTKSRAEELADLFGPQVKVTDHQDLPRHLTKTDLLINTTSAGIGDAEKLQLPWAELKQNAVVADITYVPLVTPFLRDAKSRGHRTVTGLGMLLHQAVFGFEKWFGVKPVVTDELYTLVARDIDPDYQR